MEYRRLLDKLIVPTENTIVNVLGHNYSLWQEVSNYILSKKSFQVETKFFTKKYGWSKRFFKGSKTLCYLFPETEAFSMLIIFGEKETDRIENIQDELKKSIYDTFMKTEQLHDGRWVWIRVLDSSDLITIKKMIDVKASMKNA